MISLRVRLLALRALVALGMAALIALVTLVSGDDTIRASSYNPQPTLKVSDTGLGANPDISTTFNLAAPDANFAGVVAFSAGAPPTDADIPDGAFVGTLSSRATLGILSGACAIPVTPDFKFLDATTNTANVIDPLPPGTPDRLKPLGADTNPANGLPDGADKYPSYLNTLFPGITPRARYAAFTPLAQAGGLMVVLQFVVFEPGTQLPRLPAFPPEYGYPSVTVLQDTTVPPAPDPVTDFCTPLQSSTTIFGKTHDNPGSPPGGIAFRTNPSTPVTATGISLSFSQRDADEDGIENSLDPCPFSGNPDPPWDPRAVAPSQGQQPLQGDRDQFAGTFTPDGIPDVCDPTPDEPTGPSQPTDHDGDGFPNRGDNCPTVANPDQKDSEVEAGQPAPDGIGDACDGVVVPVWNPEGKGNPAVPDGHFHTCWRVSSIQIGAGGPGEATFSPCSETPPAVVAGVVQSPGGGDAAGGAGGTGAGGAGTGGAGTRTGGAGGGPDTGIGSLAPVASSIPAWAAIASGLGGTGLLGSLAARFLRRRRGD